jgi:hypothetical protein
MSPFLGYLILESEYHLALGVFVFAGISDLVSSLSVKPVESNLQYKLFLSGKSSQALKTNLLKMSITI